MATKKPTPSYTWYEAALTPVASGLFTDAFYPEPKACGTRSVFFTQVDITPNSRKVIVASKLSENGIRMMTLELARTCLIPGKAVTGKSVNILNELVTKLKV